jgi:predicted O-methyltransferase YrrM
MINDQGYFKEYPAPIFEASCKDHIDTVINHSTPYYGPLLYWLTRCSDANFVVEIGVCKAYSSYFLASGVKDNMTRHVCNGQYFGIDISGELPELERKLREKGLPVTMLQMDSWDITKETFGNNQLGLAFVDGWHSEQHLLKEVDLLYPMLLDAGRGYMVIHDAYGWVMKPMQKVLNNPKYKWECIRFFNNYGLAILRKMDNYVEDPDKMWPQGPEPDIRNEDGTPKEIVEGYPVPHLEIAPK